MLAPLFLALQGEAKVLVEAPGYFVADQPFLVRLSLEAPAAGARLEGWQLTAAGFSIGGQALAERGSEPALELPAGAKKTVEVELGTRLEPAGDFELAWGTLAPRRVRVLEAAPKGTKFMDEAAFPSAELARYWVLLTTNRGQILLELWPDVAPNHVRNFLDLAATGFYDDTTFHRVIPNFMIQGGDPDGSGSGNGPRLLKAEFNQKKHVRGVLSMARSPDPDSASCQFFIMVAPAPGLDNEYSAFGAVVTGMETVDRIAKTPRSPTDKPHMPQVIERALAVKAPVDPVAWKAQK